jgi:Lon protease-like protein
MGADVEILPMFPLGTVLFPSMVLPLRIFEPRYLEMTRICLEGDRRFGVVLITRGSEVGGGDARSDIGCTASIVQVQDNESQVFLATVGTGRIRVLEWLDDDPYPRAQVERWCDPAPSEGFERAVEELDAAFRNVLALAGELDEWSVPQSIELDDDPALALYQMCAASPIGAFDRHRLLCAEDLAARAALLGEVLDDAKVMLRARLEHL